MTTTTAPPSLADLFAASTTPTDDGHLMWTGPRRGRRHGQPGAPRLYHGGRDYTARQAAYLLATGQEPTGHVRIICGESECCDPAHVETGAVRTATPGWWRRAACGGLNTNVFYPGKDDTAAANYARGICANCPVRVDCLDDALTEEGGKGPSSRHGIRGAMSPTQRRREYERRQDAAQRAARPDAEPTAPAPAAPPLTVESVPRPAPARYTPSRLPDPDRMPLPSLPHRPPKLTHQQRDAIAARLDAGEKATALALEYGVSARTIRDQRRTPRKASA